MSKAPIPNRDESYILTRYHPGYKRIPNKEKVYHLQLHDNGYLRQALTVLQERRLSITTPGFSQPRNPFLLGLDQ